MPRSVHETAVGTGARESSLRIPGQQHAKSVDVTSGVFLGPASEQSVVHIHEFGPWPGRLGDQASELFLGAALARRLSHDSVAAAWVWHGCGRRRGPDTVSGVPRTLALASAVLAAAAAGSIALAMAASAATVSTVAGPAAVSAAATAGPAAVTRPASAAPPRRVVLIGIAGLRWSDVSAVATPALWRLADKGSVGSLLVSGVTAPT